MTTPLGENELLLKAFTGSEGISTLFGYRLEMIAENKIDEDALSHYTLGNAYLNRGDTEKAIAEYGEKVRRDCGVDFRSTFVVRLAFFVSSRVTGETQKRGTRITFKPDGEIFSDTELSFDVLAQRLRELAFLNRGVRIELADRGIEK